MWLRAFARIDVKKLAGHADDLAFQRSTQKTRGRRAAVRANPLNTGKTIKGTCWGRIDRQAHRLEPLQHPLALGTKVACMARAS